MSHFTDPHKPGSFCRHHGWYRTYKKTDIGLLKTEYGCEVQNPSRFPPTPGKKHVFVLEKSYEVSAVVQLSLFDYDPWADDEGTLPMAA